MGFQVYVVRRLAADDAPIAAQSQFNRYTLPEVGSGVGRQQHNFIVQ
jgi:hypothetical protein